MYGIIYCIVNNINHKRYIGQTKNSLDGRIAGHIKYYSHNVKLRRAFKKYKLKNFSCYILDYAFDKDELNKKEIYWIQFYDTCKTGYNIMSGGQFGNVLDAEIEMKRRKNISNSISGKNHWCYNESLDKHIPQMIKMRKEGMSLQKIAENFSCSRRAVESRLKEADLDISRKAMFKKRKQEGIKQCDRPLINKISDKDIFKAIKAGCDTKNTIVKYFDGKLSYNAVTNRLKKLKSENKIMMDKIITKTGWTYIIKSVDEV